MVAVSLVASYLKYKQKKKHICTRIHQYLKQKHVSALNSLQGTKSKLTKYLISVVTLKPQDTTGTP